MAQASRIGGAKLLQAWNLAAETTVDVNALLARNRTKFKTKMVVEARRHLLQLSATLATAMKSESKDDLLKHLDNTQSSISSISMMLEDMLPVVDDNANRISVIANRLTNIKSLVADVRQR